MSPLRWDVLVAGFVLAVPVLMLGVRGDLTPDEVAVRVLWCLAAGWGAVALVRLASTPRTPGPPAPADPAPADPAPAVVPEPDTEPATP
ncbi:hypothetical protein [Modestobacter sp. URMC 112]